MPTRKMLTFFAILGLCFAVSGFVSYNPAIEDEELVFIPKDAERNMGRKIDEQVREKFRLPVDPLVQERVAEIGHKLCLASESDFVYHFRVLNHEKEDFYNAFAVPGGYVYIFDDLVRIMNDDDQIAAVLAHEMGHIEARHSVKRLQGAFGAAALMILGAQMAPDAKTRARAGDAITQLMAAYSRGDERQADELSVKYLGKGGFDASGVVAALEALKKIRTKGPERKFSYYRSHPYLSERIAHLRRFKAGYTDFDSYINMTSIGE